MDDSGREWAEQCKNDGNAHFKMGEWEKAIDLYTQGVAAVDSMMFSPADDLKCACFSNTAAALIKLERWDEAIAACNDALRLDEKHLKSLLRRAQAGLRADQGAPAGKSSIVDDFLDRALAVDPACKEALSMRAEIVRERREKSAAAASQQKRIFGGFWGAPSEAKKKALYEDVTSEEAANKKEDPVCFFDIDVEGGEGGRIYFQLFRKKAPKACENFRCLSTGERGVDENGVLLHYEKTQVHRVVRGFAIQGGDVVHREGASVGKGIASIYGGAMRTDEHPSGRHLHAGQLCAANMGPNTGGCQWYVTLDEAPWLDKDFVIFGQVISGMDVVRRIETMEVADEEDHRPLRRVTITACGEVCSSEERAKVRDDAAPDPGPL